MIKFKEMYRYARVQKIVNKLTNDDRLRTFFTLYLMCKQDQERTKIQADFWNEFEMLSKKQQSVIRAELTKGFKELPGLAADLLDRFRDVSTGKKTVTLG